MATRNSDLRSQRAGRKAGTERVRELVAIIGSLCETGDSISLDAISTRLGLSVYEARTMMNIICQASGEDTGGLLISCNEEETEYTLQYPGVRGRPVRLSRAETIAFFHALDEAGVSTEDPIRQHAEDAFASLSMDEASLGRDLCDTPRNTSLVLCARSQVLSRVLEFSYRGLKDSEPRNRRALVRSLLPLEESWHVKAHDLDLGQDRTFRLDRMSNLELGERITVPNTYESTDATNLVDIVFYDASYLELYSWPGLKVLHRKQGVIHAKIPYYDNVSTWLIRRITACDNQVITTDKRIMAKVRAYAASLLEANTASTS